MNIYRIIIECQRPNSFDSLILQLHGINLYVEIENIMDMEYGSSLIAVVGVVGYLYMWMQWSLCIYSADFNGV